MFEYMTVQEAATKSGIFQNEEYRHYVLKTGLRVLYV